MKNFQVSQCVDLSLLSLSLQWLENEKLRLSHLRDRASETGRRKEYPFSLDAHGAFVFSLT